MKDLSLIRKNKGMTQKELSLASKVNYNTIKKIECGATMNPGITSVFKICSALDCTVEDLFRANKKHEK
jgi:DNA-binding XRE family transcriptional regulator